LAGISVVQLAVQQ